ncbi:hypothetical protein [Burkholderia dolosa]|uniref:hypothetical protein n=1 Tax=Burkholderia dolosa TaxID=152500 RepID=UPI0021BC0AD2|nr:hypothetical protein [Burkholderia dolosa]
MAVEQDRRVVIAFAIDSAAHVVKRGHRMPRAVAQRIQTTDDLASIDGLHERHFIEHAHARRGAIVSHSAAVRRVMRLPSKRLPAAKRRRRARFVG